MRVLTVLLALAGSAAFADQATAPAGVKFDNTGHHHLLIDTELPADLMQPLPVSDAVHTQRGFQQDHDYGDKVTAMPIN
ncbi:MAG: DUF4399 domain-containing protein [Steroidobacterales bacterium]